MRAKEIRRLARENLAGNWGRSVVTAFIAAFFGGLIYGSFSLNLEIREELQALPESVLVFLQAVLSVAGILSLVQFILGGAVQLGYTNYLLKQYHRANFEVKDLFSRFDRFGQGFAQKFLRSLYTALWTLLFIIPGIVKAYSYAMTPFIMEENPGMRANDAITASREMMAGRKWDLFCLELSFIGWGFLNLFTLGIGSLFLNPYINAAHAVFYKHLSASGKEY